MVKTTTPSYATHTSSLYRCSLEEGEEECIIRLDDEFAAAPLLNGGGGGGGGGADSLRLFQPPLVVRGTLLDVVRRCNEHDPSLYAPVRRPTLLLAWPARVAPFSSDSSSTAGQSVRAASPTPVTDTHSKANQNKHCAGEQHTKHTWNKTENKQTNNQPPPPLARAQVYVGGADNGGVQVGFAAAEVRNGVSHTEWLPSQRESPPYARALRPELMRQLRGFAVSSSTDASPAVEIGLNPQPLSRGGASEVRSSVA